MMFVVGTLMCIAAMVLHGLGKASTLDAIDMMCIGLFVIVQAIYYTVKDGLDR